MARPCPNKHRNEQINSQRLLNVLKDDDAEKMVNIFAHLGKLPQNTRVTANEESNTRYRLVKDVELQTGELQQTLVDTGATISSIPSEMATKLNLYTFITLIKYIQYGSGASQPTRNKAILKFSVNGVSTRAFPYVVEKQNTGIILGMDWMVHEDWALRPKAKELFKVTDYHNTQVVKTREEQLAEEILNGYPSLVPSDDKVQTVTNALYKHRINTGDALTVHVHDYRRPHAENEQVKKEVAEMLKKKVIEPNTSAWCSPVVLTNKGDHDQAVKDGTPPQCNLNELLDQLHGYKYLRTIDLKAGYWQLPMDLSDAHKTAFIADGALYQFRVLHFRCVTAPNAFARFMAEVTSGLKHCKVYLDDIIVFIPLLEAYEEDLRSVLSRLAEYNLKISIKKRKFFKREVEYLGFIVSDQGIRSNPAKVQVIKDWQVLTSVAALQRFPGFCAFYHQFIKSLDQVASPLYKLLRKDTLFEWFVEANKSLEELKKIIMRLPTLVYPDPSKPYDGHTDASMHGLGAVIVQDRRLPASASRTLTPAEKITHFYPYLYGATLTTYTDHVAFKSILSTKEPKDRISRWRLAIQGYSFTIAHRKGVFNADTVALSRRDQVSSEGIQEGAAGDDPTLSQVGDGAVQRLSGIFYLQKEQLQGVIVRAILKEGAKKPFFLRISYGINMKTKQ
ncbi:hypothetical protein G6F43_012424 [Rhizopus delemar]|nr:hypothetical protein G6F43_012424 [Rhizopus delemar]